MPSFFPNNLRAKKRARAKFKGKKKAGAKKGQGQNIEGKKQQKTRAKLGEENEKNKIYLKNI